MPKTVHIKLSPSALSGRLNRELQRADYLLRIGLNASVSDAAALVVPDRTIHFAIDAGVVWDADTAKREFSTWVLTNAFRDVAEAIAGVLEDLQGALAAVALVEHFGGRDALRIEEWEAECQAEVRRFHRLGLPDKLDYFHEHAGVVWREDLKRQLLSINAARNCLVHRAGVVAERDTNEPGKLVVYWRRLHMAVEREGRRVEVELPYTKQEGDTILFTESPTTREFKVGERISFSTADFGDICYTLHRFGVVLSDLALRVLRGSGPVDEPPSLET